MNNKLKITGGEILINHIYKLIIENTDEIYNKYKNFFITKDELNDFLVNVIKENELDSFEDSFEDEE